MHEVVLFGDGEAVFENVDRRREVTAKDVHVAEEGVGDRQAGRVADVRRDLQTFGCGCERGIEASEGRSRFRAPAAQAHEDRIDEARAVDGVHGAAEQIGAAIELREGLLDHPEIATRHGRDEPRIGARSEVARIGAC